MFLPDILMKLVLESVKKQSCLLMNCVKAGFANPPTNDALQRLKGVIRFCLYPFSFFGYSAKLIAIISYLMVKTVESLPSVLVCLAVDLTRPGLTAISERLEVYG